MTLLMLTTIWFSLNTWLFLFSLTMPTTKIFFVISTTTVIREIKKQLFDELAKVAAKEKIFLEEKGSFGLEQKGEEVEIHFSMQ